MRSHQRTEPEASLLGITRPLRHLARMEAASERRPVTFIRTSSSFGEALKIYRIKWQINAESVNQFFRKKACSRTFPVGGSLLTGIRSLTRRNMREAIPLSFSFNRTSLGIGHFGSVGDTGVVASSVSVPESSSVRSSSSFSFCFLPTFSCFRRLRRRKNRRTRST